MPQASQESPRQIDSLQSSERLGNSAKFIRFAERIHNPDAAKRFTPQTPLIYTSTEFGIDGLGYTGGLGVLSGDHMRGAVSIDAPIIGIGLRYRERNMQVIAPQISMDGKKSFAQVDKTVPLLTPEELGMTLCEDIHVEVNGAMGPCCEIPVHSFPLGNEKTKLYLLDVPGQVYPEKPSDDSRLWHNTVLGFGGYQVVKQLTEQGEPIDPAAFHLNESATALMGLAALDDLTTHYNGDYNRALAEIRQKTLGTNHTLVPAAEACYSIDQAEKFIIPNLKSDRSKFELRSFIQQRGGELKPLDLMLYLTGTQNGVSQFHAEISTNNFRKIYGENYYGNSIEFKPVTNGIDIEYWAKQMAAVLRKHDVLDEFDMPNDDDPAEFERLIAQIPAEEILDNWADASKDLREYLDKGDRRDQLGNVVNLPEDAIIYGDARRMAGYKQRDMMFRDHQRVLKGEMSRDEDRLVKFLTEHPRVHIFIAGKSHPTDDAGKGITRIVLDNIASDPLFRERIHFMPDWDLQLAQKLIPAVNVWLNNPRRGEEACGTSGEKSAANGEQQVSVDDGWIREQKDGTYHKIVGEPGSKEETDSYYANLNNSVAIAENSELAVDYARKLWAGGALRIACAPAMLERYFDLLTQQRLQKAA